jgi:hypothetical protein
MDDEERVRKEVIRVATELVESCLLLGLNITITKQSVQPFAMGNTATVIEIWPTAAARKEEE